MITSLLLYLGATFLLAIVDWLRIHQTWNKVDNINHTLSFALGIAACAVWLVWRPNLPLFLIGCGGVRLLFYSPLLNIIRGLPVAYTSGTSNNQTDRKIRNFWLQRGIGAVVVIVVLIINHSIFNTW